jgi:hypothetical protein
MHHFLVDGDGLVDINEVSAAREVVSKAAAEIGQINELHSMAIGSEMDGLFKSGYGIVDIKRAFKALEAV